MQKESEKVDRRTVLQALGATGTAAVGTLSIPTAKGKSSGEKVGTTTLSSVYLKYRGAPTTPQKRIDDIAGYHVDTDTGEAVLTEMASDRERTLLTSGEPLVQAVNLESAPASSFGGTNRTSLPTSESSWLQTEDAHTVPEIETAYRGSEFLFSIDGRGEDIVLGAGEETRIELNPVTAKVTKTTDDTKEVTDNKTGGTMRVSESTTETVSLNPVLEAINLGELPVYEVRQ